MTELTKLPDEVFLSRINIAGTHDSATAYVDFESQARCQSMDVLQQLNMGVRLLDIRLSVKAGRYFLVHSLANCYEDKGKTKLLYFDKVLEICREFLLENPGETVLMSIKQDRGLQRKSFFEGFYSAFIKGNENIWYLENEIPRLKDCRGKIVLIRRCKLKRKFLSQHKCGLDFSYWKDQKRKKYTPKKVILNHSFTATVQDRYRLAPKEKWYKCAKPFLDSCITDIGNSAVHFLSTSSKGTNPLQAAEYINPLFGEYTLPSDRAVGWILMDFPDEELCRKINGSNYNIYERDDIK